MSYFKGLYYLAHPESNPLKGMLAQGLFQKRLMGHWILGRRLHY